MSLAMAIQDEEEDFTVNTTAAYLRDLHGKPLMTAEEELERAKRIEARSPPGVRRLRSKVSSVSQLMY